MPSRSAAAAALRRAAVVFPALPLATVLLAFPPSVRAADGTWIELAPPSRRGHTAIYDPVRDRMLVFGGSQGDARRAEVWALALSSPAWTELRPEGPGPSARSGHTAVYDPVRDRMLVFGGTGGGYPPAFHNDVWELSLAGQPAWSLVTPAGTPPSPRSEHAAIYDPAGDRMLVYSGGVTVWELALGGVPTWSELATSGALPSVGESAIYDPVRERMLVFGGGEDGVWALDLGGLVWSQVVPPGQQPGPRIDHVVVYDPVRDRMIVAGGCAVYWPGGVGDAWALPLAEGAAWQRLPNSYLCGHAGIYDPVRDVVVVYGGSAIFGDSSVTLRLTLGPSPTWKPLFPSGFPSPALAAHTAVYDPAGARMIVYGGFTSGCIDPCDASSGTSLYALGDEPGWVSSFTGPPGRADHSAVYDSARERMVVFGGDPVYGEQYNDTWALDLSGGLQWSALTPSGTSPSPRRGHTAIYDPARDRMLVFGGTDGSLLEGSGGNLFNAVWSLSFDLGVEWTQLAPLGTPPSPRTGHAAVYDPVRDRMVVFGGRDASGVSNDLWALSLLGVPQWEPLSTGGAPPAPREGHMAVYDPLRDRMIVFGGTQAGDTWILDLAALPAPTWVALDAEGMAHGGRHEHTAVYDAAGDRMVVYGGGSSLSPAVTLLAFAEGPVGVEAEVDSPGIPGFALYSVRPNPASGRAIEVAFALPGASPTVLELFDVGGRSLLRRDLGILGEGDHVRRLDGGRLSAGTYLIRITHAGRSLGAKVSVMP